MWNPNNYLNDDPFKGYSWHRDEKLMNITEDGSRFNLYPENGFVTFQPPGMGHQEYREGLDKSFSEMDPVEFSNTVMDILKNR